VATYWDEGIQASIIRLQALAQHFGNADWVARAKDLQKRLEGDGSQWWSTNLLPPVLGGNLLV